MADRVVQRECIEGPDIHGSYHHYGHLDWWAPEDQFDGEYARPTCPVSQLGCVDEPAECTRIAERITDDEGRGAWFCGAHGTFRVFDYPRERQRNSPGEQQTLIADGGRERPEGGLLHRLYWGVRKHLSGVEWGERYYLESHRLNVTYYYNEDDERPTGSHCDVRAWWLTEDELVAETDPQPLGEDNTRTYPRDRIVHADITRGPTIIDRGEDVYR